MPTISDSNSLHNLKGVETRKQYIRIIVLSTLSIIFLMTFGFNSLNNGQINLSKILFLTTSAIAINLVTYLYKRNYELSANIFGLSAIVLCIILISTGGFNNTGPMWVYSIMTIILLLNSFKSGVIFCGSFFLFLLLVLSLDNGMLIQAEYPEGHFVRFIFTLFILFCACLFTVFLHERSLGEISLMHKKLDEAANQDSLTKLYNRHFINNNYILNNYFNDSVGKDSYLLLIDIDHFKRVNDTFGHDIGDKVLIKISNALMSAVRPGDVVARWGGEEFLIILSGISKEVGIKRAEKVCKKIEDLNFKAIDIPFPVTVSIGVATINTEKKASSIIKLADENLYRAKESGRNQVDSKGLS